jgi:hypothetical protein
MPIGYLVKLTPRAGKLLPTNVGIATYYYEYGNSDIVVATTTTNNQQPTQGECIQRKPSLQQQTLATDSCMETKFRNTTGRRTTQPTKLCLLSTLSVVLHYQLCFDRYTSTYCTCLLNERSRLLSLSLTVYTPPRHATPRALHLFPLHLQIISVPFQKSFFSIDIHHETARRVVYVHWTGIQYITTVV